MNCFLKSVVAIVLMINTSPQIFGQQETERDSLTWDPYFFTFTRTKFDSMATKDVNRVSIDVDIKTDFPKDYHYCIALLNSSFNNRGFHTGICTFTNGVQINATDNRDTVFGKGGVFTRWTKDLDMAQIKTNGYFEKHDKHYGGYVSIRNWVIWGKGKYRVSLYISGYKPGKYVSQKMLEKSDNYPITEYEHTWVTMEVENLEDHSKWIIGEMAFPGKTLTLGTNNQIFIEHYGSKIYIGDQSKKFDTPVIYYKNLPQTNFVVSNLQINGKVQSIDNGRDPLSKKLLLASYRFDKEKNLLYFETGKFNGWEVLDKK